VIILRLGMITDEANVVVPEALTAVPDARVEAEALSMTNADEVQVLTVSVNVIAMVEGPLLGLPEMNLS